MKLKNICITLFMYIFVTNIHAQELKHADPKDIALYPQQNEIRNTLNISGIWKFKVDSAEIGEDEKWYDELENPRLIAVPGSWNDQFNDLGHYLGAAWYETETYIPASWRDQKVFLRIGSANYQAKVWINGEPLGKHEGGHLPFAFEISSRVKWNQKNRISIQVHNKLSADRVPPGNAPGPFRNEPATNYDFFPYAGLNRDVHLYSMPREGHIKDITIRTDFNSTTGIVNTEVEKGGKATNGEILITGDGKEIVTPFSFNDHSETVNIKVPDVRLWSPDDPFLYSVSVKISNGDTVIDQYHTETGIRTIESNNKEILLNGKPIFLKGFGKHEDFPIYGRGTAPPVMVKDFELMKWTGANSFRTSHYPYDEAFYKMADREGFLIINEIPAVGLFFHGDTTAVKKRHALCKQYLDELIMRDKNHPSVIMWSVANEPFPETLGNPTSSNSSNYGIDPAKLLGDLVQQAKTQDPTRLTTIVGVMTGPMEWLRPADVVSINRYWGWYTNYGDAQRGGQMISAEVDRLHEELQKPVFLTEFGAGAMAGRHDASRRPEIWTEEYQVEFIKSYLDMADTKDFMAGMHVWSFADFKTPMSLSRFGGFNLKGVFTRTREPKAAAHYLRSRWNNSTKKKLED